MKLRELLKKIRPNPKPLEGEGERPVDNIAGWGSGAMKDSTGGNVPATFPPNYVPPPDDERSRP